MPTRDPSQKHNDAIPPRIKLVPAAIPKFKKMLEL